MIPSLVVSDIRAALVEFLTTTFALSDDDVRDELTSFLRDRSEGIFRGPYLRVRTPYRAVDDGWTSPLGWLPDGFIPYQHQAASFDRLTSAEGHTPEPTLVTTGTGSGKTECFLFPILDHCARQRLVGTPGIKALILYPMNALASDQAGRLAELIHTDPHLAGLRAGLYVGESGRHSKMGGDQLIDKREVLRADPPDILLTNYKMLDFLLLRREDRNLWAANEPDTLQYVVLDEFHTYDGAQGTDVAMLLRRLGRTLGMNQPARPLGGAAPVATSATLGTGSAALDELREFAGKVFGVEFDPRSVIGETRQTVEEACGELNYYLSIPEIDDLIDVGDDLDALAAAFCREERPAGADDHDGPDDITDPVTLGERLLRHPLTRAVLSAVGGDARSWPDALAEINTRAPNWGRTALTRPEAVERALGQFLMLLSIARRRQGTRIRPLFSVEVQLWVREVSRLLREVSDTPAFRWLDSAAPEPGLDSLAEHADPALELPAIYCRRCGQSGWRAIRSDLGGALQTNPRTIYAESLRRGATVRDLIAAHPDDPNAKWLDPSTRLVGSVTGEGATPVLLSDSEDDARAQRCPACGDRDSMRFVGLQVASLASVSLNTLFGSPHLDDNERKLLAFTDSVQDASHRAAFFSGRTHRFNLRTRMAAIIEDAGDISLYDLGDELFASAESPRDRFGVVPPDLLRDPAVKTVWSDDPEPRGLDALRSRLGFEVDVEFGLRARVGRTLEMSGVAAAAVDVPRFDEVADLVAEHLRHLDGDAGGDTLAGISTYLRGLLERLRLRGGIAHPLLQPYLDNGGRQWFVWGGRPHGLPPFNPGQGRPTFMTTAIKGDFDSLSTVGTTPTWALDWVVRTLGVEPAIGRDLNLAAMSLLADHGEAIVATSSPGGKVWGLDRRAVRVWDIADDEDDSPPTLLRCTICGTRLPVPAHLAGEWHGGHCLRYRCIGRYEVDQPDASNYYRRLYRSGVTRRVVAAEHTGVLDRRSREDLEAAFKAGTAPDAPNVITATPTLEMGIDIGDLSAVMLTSVPRNPASYIQRVGRAGRLNGNALITTFVRTDTHGLYYLSDPEAMISGDVRPPNCYLDAIETLQRQYVASLLDRIADLTIEAEPLPQRIGILMRDGLDDGSHLRTLVDASMLDPTHLASFLALFEGHLDTDTVRQLTDFATAGIEAGVKAAVDEWRAEERELELRRNRLKYAIDALFAIENRTDDEEEQVRTFIGQRKAIIRLLQRHRNDYTLSALERLGLLPNYTLRGDTATLHATLWSRDDDGNYSVEPPLEYTRSARLAITEFAPGNSFYAGGHKHTIDTLEIGAATEPLYETWRLCPECGYADIELEGQPTTSCPRCASIAIADTGTRFTVLRLRTAMASSSEENARVYDERDERHRERYEVIDIIDADPAHVAGAWALSETPFGAELSGRTRLRRINLGFRERRGEQIPIAGEDRHVTQFSVCRHCGGVRDVRDDNKGTRPDRLHLGWCKVRSGSASEQWDSVVLLHELVTEAVRLLLPVSMFEVDERLASFKGALLLGLREDFGGDPDHLEVARMQMPNREGQGHRQFLVLYDNVPGGTGYLARLADPERMKTILEAGRRVIAQCPCRLEGRRACHRCLLGVVDTYEYDIVGRDLALALLDGLLAQWDPQPENSVSHVDIGRVEESELERRFKVAVRTWAERADNDHVTFRTVPGHNGRDAFELLFAAGEGTIRYRTDEQEGLGTTPSTVPDFSIHRQDAPAPDVAVYLDGYQFHASATINNLADDAAKRAGVRIDEKLVWNITWRDVDEFHRSVIGEDLRSPPPRPLLSAKAQGVANSLHHHGGGAIDFSAVNQNPVSLLLDYLRQPDAAEWERLALSAVGGAANEAEIRHSVAAADLEAVMRSGVGGASQWPADAAQPVALAWQLETRNGLPMMALLDAADPAAERWTAIATIPSLAADVESAQHRERWYDWMQWANVLQFLRGYGRGAVISATTQADEIELDHLWLLDGAATGVAGEVAGEVAGGRPSAARPLDGSPRSETIRDGPDVAPGPMTELSDDQQADLELISDSAVRDLLRAVLSSGVHDPVPGFEVDGEPIEAVWPDQRVGIAAEGQPLDVAGYDIRLAENWDIDELLGRLREVS